MSAGLWSDLAHFIHSALFSSPKFRTNSRASSKERHRLFPLPKSTPTRCACQRQHYRNGWLGRLTPQFLQYIKLCTKRHLPTTETGLVSSLCYARLHSMEVDEGVVNRLAASAKGQGLPPVVRALAARRKIHVLFSEKMHPRANVE